MDDTLEIIKVFENAFEAELARGRLESEGIPSFLRDNHIVEANWMLSNAVGGVKLAVRANDVGRAREILDSAAPEMKDEGWGACPSCGSCKLEIRTDRRITNLTWLFFGIPLLLPRRAYFCRSCGEITKRPAN